jgi:8-oxo-dGTP pyrophosphatase MutT (NUDIX family)
MRPGGPAPWATLAIVDRAASLDRLRTVFDGRVGAPSVVEGRTGVAASGVLAPFYEHDGELFVLLTRRSWDLRSHTGEVSFPGGRADAGESPAAAALREATEEIGLDAADVEVLGELDHLMTVTSGSFIVPFVGLLPGGRPEGLVANPDEVEAVLHVPVAELLLDEVYREEQWDFSGLSPEWSGEDAFRPIYFFELVGDTVWGATAAMLRQLLGLLLGIGDTGIDHP